MATRLEKILGRCGPGGYNCYCCGPAPRDRKAFRRLTKRRLRALVRKEIRETLEEKDSKC